MTAVGRTDTGDIVVGAVGIAGILGVAVLGHDVVGALALGQREPALAMGYPDAELVAAQAAKHNAVVLGNIESEEGTLKLV